MHVRTLFCLLALSYSGWLRAATGEEPQLLVDKISWPESPLIIGKDVYYVAYGSNDVLRLRDKQVEVFWHQDGCGPSAILALDNADFVVTCYDSNSVVRISPQAEVVSVIVHDELQHAVQGPNDFVSDHKGGYYFSASGVFDPAAPVVGKVFHVDATGRIEEVAADIHYSNGLALTPDSKTLLVAEHLEARLLAFDVGENGRLSGRRIWRSVDELVAKPEGAPATYGCDGIKIDAAGRVYITNYGAGRILITDEDGNLLNTVMVPDAFVDNLAVTEDGWLYVTAVRDESASPYPGALYLLRNPVWNKAEL